MQHLTIQQTADYLEAATIAYSHDLGHAIIHTGKNAAGAGFVLVNNWIGQTTLTEAL
ncbi:MAG: hypothetical protein H6R07_3260 [Proteobacteria bacterium]|nr:hypothetical protein [Pseudomonadota bacterium]